MADLRHIVDYMKSEYDRKIRAQTEKGEGEMVQGIRYNCVREVSVLGETYETV